MADNVTLNAGAGGDTVAADDIGGVKYQRVKVTFGADGVATDVSSANPLPVIGASNSGVDIGDVTVNNGTGASAVPIQDGGNSITVDGSVTADTELTTADLDTGAGTDTRAVVGLAGAASGGAVLIQGTAGGALKGDLTTIAGTAPDVNSGSKGGGTLRMVLATDQPQLTNALKVDGSAVTQPVSGTVGVTNADLTTLGALSRAEDAAHSSGHTGIMALAVRQDTATQLAGTDADYSPLITDASGRLHVNVGNTVAVGSHAVTNAGTFAVQESGAALTSLQLIDDAVYAEDVASQAADKGISVLAVRRDADTSLVGTDGDYANLQVNASGALKVAITSGAGSGGTSLADNAAFTPGSTSFTPIGGEVDDTATTDATENSAAAVRMTVKRAIHVNLRDNAGNELSVGGATQYDEDAASAGAEKLTLAGTVRRDSAASSSGTDGDYSTLNTDANGRLWVNPSGVTLTVGSHAVTNAGTFAVQADSVVPGSGATNLGKAEDAAHSSGDVGVMALSVRQNTAGATSGADGDYQPLITDTNGRLHVLDANSASALTSLQLIDDVVVAEDAAHGSGDKGVMALAVRAASPTDRSAGATDGDYEPIGVNEVGAVWGTLTPSANGGCSTFMASGSDGSSILVATAQAVKASAGVLYGYYAYNPEAAVTFVHFYNTAAASVTVGTTNPLFTVAIPAGSAANLALPYGIAFSNAGWSVAATTTAGGNTAPATGVSLVAWYK